jgi:hypothetical protein
VKREENLVIRDLQSRLEKLQKEKDSLRYA